MAIGITATNLSNALKVLYRGQKLDEVVFGSSARPLMNNLKKMEEFSGSTYPLPVYYEDAAGGRSAAFSNAQTNNSGMQIGKFDIDVVANHQVVQISTEALLRSRNSKGSFLAHQKMRVDTALNNLANDVERGLFRDGTGVIGRVNNGAGELAQTGLELITPTDAKNFHIGGVVKVAASATGALRAGSLTVAAVDFEAALGEDQVTMTANLSTGIAAIAQNDYIFYDGDGQNGGSTPLKISGTDAWFPETAPGATLFFGQNRSLHKTRLGGCRQPGSLSDIAKAIIDACAHMGSVALADGSMKAFMSYTTWALLADQVRRDVLRKPAKGTTAGYQYISVYGSSGEVHCIPSPFCQENVIWLLNMDTLELVSMGKCVRINDDDGLMARALGSDTGLEIRADSHAQFASKAPGKSCRIALS